MMKQKDQALAKYQNYIQAFMVRGCVDYLEVGRDQGFSSDELLMTLIEALTAVLYELRTEIRK